MTKKCNKCGIEKNINDFYKGNAKCKSCKIQYQKNYSLDNKETIKEYKHKWHIDNIIKVKKKKKENYVKNKEHIKEKSKKNYSLNKEKKIKYQTDYQRKRRNTDPLYKLKHSTSHLIRESLKNKGFKKNSKTIQILGCSYEDFKLYLESKFENWMNWENRGLYNGEFNYGWDIDHIIPLYTAEIEEDIIRLNHYSNLQPLCSKINREIKRNNLEYIPI